MTPPSCGASFQPISEPVASGVGDIPNSGTGFLYDTQNATVGEWVYSQNGNGVGPYKAVGVVRETINITNQPYAFAGGNYYFIENWSFSGDAGLTIWGISNAGGVLTASYVMTLGLIIQPATGPNSTFTVPYSTGQIQCTAPCSLAKASSLSGSSQVSFTVTNLPAGSYTFSAFIQWGTNATETGTGDAAATSCLNMGSGPWCNLGQGSLAAGWAQLTMLGII